MILDELGYRHPSTYLALSLLYDDSAWGSRQEQDHIFPKSLFTKRALKEGGFDEETQEKMQGLRDSFGNLQLLIDSENRQKSNTPFDRWLKTRAPAFLKLHLIPDEPRLWNIECFLEFVEAREKLIRKRLNSLFSPDK